MWRLMVTDKPDPAIPADATRLLRQVKEAGIDPRAAASAITGFDVAIEQDCTDNRVTDYRLKAAQSVADLVVRLRQAVGVPSFPPGSRPRQNIH